jgi:signal transduction histidine kinase
MDYLASVLTDDQLPAALRNELSLLHSRALRHLCDVQDAVDAFLAVSPDIKVDTFDPHDAVADAVNRVQPLADTLGVSINVELQAGRPITAPRDALVEAIVILCQNAVQAERPPGRTKQTVEVAYRSRETGHEIHVSDNGTGVSEALVDELFSSSTSTKGRPGAGLTISRELLALFRATVQLTKNGPTGATFSISVPSDSDIRKEQS